MSTVLAQYTVMQQNEWAERKFYQAQDRRTGQVVYLIEEPASGRTDPYDHACLPSVKQLVVEGGTRWLQGALPDGDTLEDLRSRGGLTEQDIMAALLSVVDALSSLSNLTPPVVPSYLDPACIKRDRLGRWTLDYLALAHAMEARMAPHLPLGVHPVGVLLYWLITGQTARRTRVQVTKMQQGVPSALQFIVIKCLGRSYPSLAELRADLERAGNEREFRAVVGLISQQRHRAPAAQMPAEPVRLRVVKPPAAPENRPDVVPAIEDVPVLTQAPPDREPMAVKPPLSLEYRKLPLGGPSIPVDDKPWALPPRPDEGYRRYVVPPPPNPVWQKVVRWGTLSLISLTTAAVSAGVAIKADLVPQEYLPAFLRTVPAVSAYPGMARAGALVGPEISGEAPSPGELWKGRLDPVTEPGDPPVPVREPDPPSDAKPAPTPDPKPDPRPEPKPAPKPDPKPDPKPEPKPEPTPKPDPKPNPAPEPQPAPQPEPEPARPPVPTPAPGSVEELDARTGGIPVLLHLDGHELGYAFVFPHPRHPYLSLGAYNRLFGRTLYWTPVAGGIRLFTSDGSFVTSDYDLVQGRLWLKLTPELQQQLGLQLQVANQEDFHFATWH